jgi:hypothetical protein
MTKSIAWREGTLLLFFFNTDFEGLGDAGGLRGSVALGNIYLSLHESNPGIGGNQLTGETTYPGYNPAARLAVPRGGAGWIAVANRVANIAQATFPTNSGAITHTITHVVAGTAVSGAGKIGYITTLTWSSASQTQ